MDAQTLAYLGAAASLLGIAVCLYIVFNLTKVMFLLSKRQIERNMKNYTKNGNEHIFGYSKTKWSKFIGYEKFEYDIILKSGEQVDNCIGGRSFRKSDFSMNYDMMDILLIRYSRFPKTPTNNNTAFA